ncbi:uncharacterized protein B0I36DRAFT_430716 [Microdochium trichocladiopsis]|uniref:LPXTG-domain-containing protein n=1 Tax=Microdochium trichocladiopsis TaxID=1682393 RepID=A0A9P9BS91_9PEZI|nr:uncharacterized protein B0I36DRAFT_430716 [Microdochium trichocladiopsis]KAH7033508.1 hypothetical protein B0I36DRAFT_430716 [Microdochium trichocladiopsis]
MTRILSLVFAPLFFQHVLSLQVTPNSPCSSFCVDSNDLNFADPNSSNTKNKDIVCYDSEYQSSPAGQKFQRCLSCLQDSTYSQGSESDQLWFLYNLRYAVDYCIFGFPNATNVASTPCSTEKACGQLEGALTGDLLSSAKKADYAFCDANGGVMRSEEIKKCHACVSASDDQDFLANYVVALDAGCQQQPSQGVAIGLSDTVFTKENINTVDPSTTNTTSQKTLGTPVLVGIGIGAAVVLLLLAGIIFVCCRRRRNKRLRLGDGDRQDRMTSQEYPISPLSFHCQAHPSGFEPTTLKGSARATVEESKVHPGPIDFTASPKMLEASAYEKPNYGGWQPQLPKSRMESKNDRSPTSLNSIQTTNPTPTIPGNVHYAWSPHITRFSPVEDLISPQSTTSTTSTTALLPLKPYNPAEWGSPVVSIAEGVGAATPTIPTPTSAATASPLLGRSWGDIPRKSSLPIQVLRQQPQQEKKEPWGELPPRPSPTPRKNTTTLETVTLAVAGGRTARTATAAMPPPKRGSSRARNSGTSPVEASQITIAFAGPPKR